MNTDYGTARNAKISKTECQRNEGQGNGGIFVFHSIQPRMDTDEHGFTATKMHRNRTNYPDEPQRYRDTDKHGFKLEQKATEVTKSDWKPHEWHEFTPSFNSPFPNLLKSWQPGARSSEKQ